MLILITILTIAYLLYLLWEKKTNDKALASFRHVIHVNGIRGKTSTCRLIDAHLRGAGFRVFTKTTGSTPCWIGVDGEEHEIRRWGSANIAEQLKMIRRACREGAEILIIECMAVQPELQRTAQTQMVKGDLNVITNVRYDHIFEMGQSLEEIAESLSGTIPENGVLFTADPEFYPYFQKIAEERHTKVLLCTANESGTAENEAIAAALGTYLGIPSDSFRQHIAHYREDFGAQKLYEKEHGHFLNLFSVNDPQSTKALVEGYYEDTSDLVFLYNNRADRPDRLLLFARYFFSQVPHRKVIVIGEARSLAVRILKKHGIYRVETAENWRRALNACENSDVVGIGNIKGQAYDMISRFEGGCNK